MDRHYINDRALSIPAFDSLDLPPELIADLRSDHAGETGAVEIYRGILAITRDPVVRAFAEDHIETERQHLTFFECWLPRAHHSRLLPLWRLAGWVLGAGSAVFGRNVVFLTVTAVETFVERHYLEQIEAMSEDKRFGDLREVLQDFCNDEVHHRDDAKSRVGESDNVFRRGWARIVGAGSALGVRVARKV